MSNKPRRSKALLDFLQTADRAYQASGVCRFATPPRFFRQLFQLKPMAIEPDGTLKINALTFYEMEEVKR